MARSKQIDSHVHSSPPPNQILQTNKSVNFQANEVQKTILSSILQ